MTTLAPFKPAATQPNYSGVLLFVDKYLPAVCLQELNPGEIQLKAIYVVNNMRTGDEIMDLFDLIPDLFCEWQTNISHHLLMHAIYKGIKKHGSAKQRSMFAYKINELINSSTYQYAKP
jgi:hypothetical protein